MKIPEVTKPEMVDWLKTKKPREIVGTANCTTGCLLFNYLAEHGIEVININPSYNHYYRPGLITYTDERGISQYRRMTPFEDEIGAEFDGLAPIRRREHPIDAAKALTMRGLADA